MLRECFKNDNRGDGIVTGSPGFDCNKPEPALDMAFELARREAEDAANELVQRAKRSQVGGLSPAAGVLLGLLERRGRSWAELHAAGLDWRAASEGAVELAVAEKQRVCLSPRGIELIPLWQIRAIISGGPSDGSEAA